MKIELFLIFLIVFSSSGKSESTILPDCQFLLVPEAILTCYDPNVDINVGDQFSWIVNEINQTGSLYGKALYIDKLSVNLEVFNDDFKGQYSSHVFTYASSYFHINLTVDGEIFNEDKLIFKLLYPFRHFWIQPTLSVTGEGIPVENHFETLLTEYQSLPNGSYIESDPLFWSRKTNITEIQSIENGIHILKKSSVTYDYYNPIAYTIELEVRTNITNGIIQCVSFQKQSFESNNYYYSYIVNNEFYIDPKSTTAETETSNLEKTILLDPFPLVIIVVLFLIYTVRSVHLKKVVIKSLSKYDKNRKYF